MTTDLSEFRLAPGPRCAKPPKDLFGLRIAYCQELRVIGMKVKEIAERLSIQAGKVGWYANPSGYSPYLFPVPLMVIDPSPFNNAPVLYDEFGICQRDGMHIWLRLFMEHLVTEGGVEKSLDYDQRTALFRSTPKLNKRMWADFPDPDDEVPPMPPQGHLIEVPKLRQVLPHRVSRHRK